MTKPFYLLQGTIIRSKQNVNDLFEINEVFNDESLIAARQKAFHKFQSYIDVFLDSIGSKYRSYPDAVEKLSDFVNSHRVEYPGNNPDLGEIEVDFDKGLFIFLVTDPSDTYTTKEGDLIYNQKIPVHFFNANFSAYWEGILNGLRTEFVFYKAKNYDTGSKAKVIKTTDKTVTHILKSPIDFQRLVHENSDGA